MCENWGNELEYLRLQQLVHFYKDTCMDFIKMIEFVENGRRKIQCLYDFKDYIKKDLATQNN